MVRPQKRRCIAGQPISVTYKPAGIPACSLEWVTLTLDEFESLRILDHLGFDQAQAAEKMGVSRPTVTRIYSSARKKIADALVLGQAIRIEGGHVTTAPPKASHHQGRCGRGRHNRNRHGNPNNME